MFLKCEKGQHMTQTERDAIEFINRNPLAIMGMSIAEIAEGANVSTSTVSRAIRKCGQKNMVAVRYRIATGDNTKKNTVKNDVLGKVYTECKRTIENIDEDAIRKLVGYIRSANKIQIVAGGLSALIAEEFVFQLQCQRYDVYVQKTGGNKERIDRLVKAGDLVIIFTCQSGKSLTNVARKAKQAGATVAFVSLIDDAGVEKHCDVVVRGYTEFVTMNQSLRITSRLGLLIITRVIVEYLALE